MLTRQRVATGGAALVLVLVIGVTAAVASDDALRLKLGPWTDAPVQERERIVTAVREADRAKATAARTFETGVLHATFADDPRVPLTGKQKDTLRRIAPATAAGGYLTFQLAFYEHWRSGADAADRVFAAQAAGRSPDRADVAAAIPRRTDPLYELPMSVMFVRVSGDYAYVEAQSEAEYKRVTLVQRHGKWLVAGEDNTPRN